MSDDLRPPSLRDTTGLPDVVRHHSLVLAKLAPGLFGGRSRIPDPIGLSDDFAADGDPGEDGDTDEPEWWDEDRFIVTGPGTVTWTLTYVPVPESLFIRWHADGGAGLPQVTPEDWTLGDDGQTVTIPDPDGLLAEGDFFSAQYQFLDVVDDTPPPPVPGSALLVGYTRQTTASTIALPSGTQAGDLLVLMLARGAFGSTPTCTDTRMVTVHGESNGSGTIGHLVAYGFADASGSAIPVHLTAGAGDAKALLVAYRITGRVAGVTISTGGFSAGAGNCIPTLPSVDADQAVIAVAGVAGLDLHDATGDWANEGSSRNSVGSAQAHSYTSTSGLPTAHFTDTGGSEVTTWMACVVALGED